MGFTAEHFVVLPRHSGHWGSSSHAHGQFLVVNVTQNTCKIPGLPRRLFLVGDDQDGQINVLKLAISHINDHLPFSQGSGTFEEFLCELRTPGLAILCFSWAAATL